MLPQSRKHGTRDQQSKIQNPKSKIPGLLILLATSGALADSPRDLIEKGNALYRSGQFAEALEAYAKVADPPPELVTPEWLNNRAAAHFKLGQYELARDLWVRAAGMRDPAFEASCRYNLGNVSYREALDSVGANSGASGGQPVTRPSGPPATLPTTITDPAETDGPKPVPLNKVLDRLDAAIGHYRDALRLDPTLVDARANLELAEQLKKQLKEQATSQPQSQSQPSPEQQDKPEQDPNQQDQNSSQPASQPEDQQDPSQSQPSSQPDQQQQPQSQPQSQPSEEDQDQKPQSQPASQSQPQSQPQPQPASQPETQPAGDEQQPAIPISISKEEAERLLQKVRDAERARRQALKQREAGKHKPVEKDW